MGGARRDGDSDNSGCGDNSNGRGREPFELTQQVRSSSSENSLDDNNVQHVYDQNRNLNLLGDQAKLADPSADDSAFVRAIVDQKEVVDGGEQLVADRRRPNASPVCSLTNSDGTGGGASGCSTTDTNQTTCSTQRMSQISLVNILADQQSEDTEPVSSSTPLLGEDTERHHDDRQQPMHKHGSQQHISANLHSFNQSSSSAHPVKPSELNYDSTTMTNMIASSTTGHVKFTEASNRKSCSTTSGEDMLMDEEEGNHERRNNSIIIRMMDDELRAATTADNNVDANEDDRFRSFDRGNANFNSQLNHQLRHDDESKEDKSLAHLVGRRMSAIPHLFARRKSKPINSMGQLSEHDGGLTTRRYSMQNPFPNLPDSQPTTVAGVGGTITTVTRSTRKTAPLPRLVAKNGTVNLFLDNIDRSQYVRDLFTTMIDIKWRYNLMAAAFGFVFSWLFFACIWYVVLYVHNDLVHESDPTWSPCIVNVNSFSAALLFSIETQSTLGFGSRIISVECPGAIVIFCIQLIFGVVVECLIVGMVFAKLSRPAKRSQTIMYSKYATVCLREGQMCLTFRVGDVRSKSHIIGATIRASLVSQKITKEGETIPFYHHQLDVKIDDSKNSLLLIWPVTIVHLIDCNSPFYELNAEQVASFKFEIITVLEGTVESTGQSIQVRSSYLPSEVRWGYRFEPIVSTHGYGRYAQTIIDYNKFNKVVEVDTPRCSPREYYSRKSIEMPLTNA